MISHGLGNLWGGIMILKNLPQSGIMIVKTGGIMFLKIPAQSGIMFLKNHREKGIAPFDLLKLLDPDSFPTDTAPGLIPKEKRHLYISFDLARPLKEQFDRAWRLCKELQEDAFLLAGQRKRRPARREVNRDVLVYTLQNSARLKIREIVQEVFPKEEPNRAYRKVQDILRRVRKAIKDGPKVTP